MKLELAKEGKEQEASRFDPRQAVQPSRNAKSVIESKAVDGFSCISSLKSSFLSQGGDRSTGGDDDDGSRVKNQ